MPVPRPLDSAATLPANPTPWSGAAESKTQVMPIANPTRMGERSGEVGRALIMGNYQIIGALLNNISPIEDNPNNLKWETESVRETGASCKF